MIRCRSSTSAPCTHLTVSREERGVASVGLHAAPRLYAKCVTPPERLRVTDLSDLHTAEQKSRSAMVTAWSLRDRLATAAAQVEGFEVDDDAAEKAAEIVETREDGWWPAAVADEGPERTIATIDDTPRPAARALDILASGGEDADAGDVHATDRKSVV